MQLIRHHVMIDNEIPNSRNARIIYESQSVKILTMLNELGEK